MSHTHKTENELYEKLEKITSSKDFVNLRYIFCCCCYFIVSSVFTTETTKFAKKNNNVRRLY